MTRRRYRKRSRRSENRERLGKWLIGLTGRLVAPIRVKAIKLAVGHESECGSCCPMRVQDAGEETQECSRRRIYRPRPAFGPQRPMRPFRSTASLSKTKAAKQQQELATLTEGTFRFVRWKTNPTNRRITARKSTRRPNWGDTRGSSFLE